MNNKEFLEYLKVVKGVNTNKIGFRKSIEDSKINMARLFTKLSKIRDSISKNIAILSLASFYDLEDDELEYLLYYLDYLSRTFIFTDKEWEDLIKEVFRKFYNLNDMKKSIKELMDSLIISSRYTNIRGEDYLIVGDKFFKLKV